MFRSSRGFAINTPPSPSTPDPQSGQRGVCWFGPFLWNDRQHGNRFLLADPMRRGGDGPGLHVSPPDVCLRPDHRLPVPPPPPPQGRQPAHLTSAASVFAARSAEAHRRSSGFILKRTPRGMSNDDPVSRDPGWKINRGLSLGGGGALACMCATTVQSRAKGGRAWSRPFYALRGRSLDHVWRRRNSFFEHCHIAGRVA